MKDNIYNNDGIRCSETEEITSADTGDTSRQVTSGSADSAEKVTADNSRGVSAGKKKKPAPRSNPNTKKTARIMLRALVLALLFCVVVFGAVIISDVFFGDDGEDTVPEIIAITVSGETVILNDDEDVTLSELRAYLTNVDEKGGLFTVALINDTSNPADPVLYNQIVDLLAEFDIVCEKMDITSTADEAFTATADVTQAV